MLGTFHSRFGTNVARRRFFGMGPREQDNNLLLLLVVSMICAGLAGVVETVQTRPAVAARPTVLASDQPAQPVRVVLPFTPNTTPSQR